MRAACLQCGKEVSKSHDMYFCLGCGFRWSREYYSAEVVGVAKEIIIEMAYGFMYGKPDRYVPFGYLGVFNSDVC